MTYILGISAFYHDSAAALVRDGEVIAAVQEERFSREKYDPRFPAQAVDFCLSEASIAPVGLDYVAFYEQPLTKFERLFETYASYAAGGVRQLPAGHPRLAAAEAAHPSRDPPGPGRTLLRPDLLPQPS